MKISTILCLLLLLSGPMMAQKDSDDKIYEVVQKQPEFPGGLNALHKYITDSLRYPEYASEFGIKETVYIECIVNKEGLLTDLHRLRGIDILTWEAIRILNESPRWIPGEMNGKPVNTKIVIPINYRKSPPNQNADNQKKAEVKKPLK